MHERLRQAEEAREEEAAEDSEGTAQREARRREAQLRLHVRPSGAPVAALDSLQMREDDDRIDDSWDRDDWVASQEPDREEVLRLARELAGQNARPRAEEPAAPARP